MLDPKKSASSVSKLQVLSQPKLLIGEGIDEVNFFKALLAHLNLDDIQVEQYNGKSGLPSYLKTLKVRPGYLRLVSLGITRDADNSCEDAFRSISGSLERIGLPVPSKLGQAVNSKPKINIFILPDNQNQGMLEELCFNAVSQVEQSCIEHYFQCIEQVSGRNPTNFAKARIHAWLATQTEPDKRLGEAAKAGFIPWNHPQFAELIFFLQNL